LEAKDIQFFRKMLESMLGDTLRRGQATINDITETVEVYADPTDRATAESNRAFTLQLRDRESQLIDTIQQTLARIDDGKFGVCVQCDEDIGLARMKASPMTTLCIHCKSQQEEDEVIWGEQ